MKLSKLTDYAVVLLSFLATGDRGPQSVSALAESTGIPAPTVAKLMKLLGKGELVISTRGTAGGYELKREARAISVAEVITAIEGPIALTACVEDSDELCAVESLCGVAGNWDRVNAAVRAALNSVSLIDMAPDWQTMFPNTRTGGTTEAA